VGLKRINPDGLTHNGEIEAVYPYMCARVNEDHVLGQVLVYPAKHTALVETASDHLAGDIIGPKPTIANRSPIAIAVGTTDGLLG